MSVSTIQQHPLVRQTVHGQLVQSTDRNNPSQPLVHLLLIHQPPPMNPQYIDSRLAAFLPLYNPSTGHQLFLSHDCNGETRRWNHQDTHSVYPAHNSHAPLSKLTRFLPHTFSHLAALAGQYEDLTRHERETSLIGELEQLRINGQRLTV